MKNKKSKRPDPASQDLNPLCSTALQRTLDWGSLSAAFLNSACAPESVQLFTSEVVLARHPLLSPNDTSRIFFFCRSFKYWS